MIDGKIDKELFFKDMEDIINIMKLGFDKKEILRNWERFKCIKEWIYQNSFI